MTHTESKSPFEPIALDERVANEPELGRVVGQVGEAALAALLRAELAPLRLVVGEGYEAFHIVLTEGLDRIESTHPTLAEGPGDDDLRLHVARACVVLAHGQEHRLYHHLLAFVRYRLGRHVFARPVLGREMMGADPAFGAALETTLARLRETTGLEPGQLLAPLPSMPDDQGANECAFCGRRWGAAMPRLQSMPASIEPVGEDTEIFASHEAILELGGTRYQVQLTADTPLQPVCSHAHVAHMLMTKRCAVYDPWLGQLAISVLEPEDDDLLVRGWWHHAEASG